MGKGVWGWRTARRTRMWKEGLVRWQLRSARLGRAVGSPATAPEREKVLLGFLLWQLPLQQKVVLGPVGFASATCTFFSCVVTIPFSGPAVHVLRYTLHVHIYNLLYDLLPNLTVP
jgi:hypothetical protein